jgi:hypothetical protein
MRQFKSPIFFGMGNHSAFEMEALKDRVDGAFSTLSGLQQGGLQGSDPDSDCEIALGEQDIKDVIADVAAALGYNIEIKEEVDRNAGNNMEQADPEDQYVVKAFNRERNIWSTINLMDSCWREILSNLPADLRQIVLEESPRMTRKSADALIEYLTKSYKQYTLDHNDRICYAIFPCNSLDRPKLEAAFDVRLKIESPQAKKIQPGELKAVIDKAISYEVKIDERIDN